MNQLHGSNAALDGRIEGFRLSPPQARLWRQQNAANAPAECGVIRAEVALAPTVDLERLAGSIRALVAAHEALRTRFVCPAHALVPFQVPDLDAAARVELSGGEPGSMTAAALVEGGGRFVIWGGKGEQRLRIELSALVADRRSVWNLVEEIERRYVGGGAMDAEPPLAYADVSEWLLDIAAQPEAETADAHWRSLDLRSAEIVPLPFARLSPPSGRRLEVSRILPATVVQGLERSGIVEALLAAYTLTVGALSSRDRVVLGLLHEGRADDALRSVIGPLEQCLPLAISIDRMATVAGFVASVETERRKVDQWAEYFDAARSLAPPVPERIALQLAYRERVPCFDAAGPFCGGISIRDGGEPYALALRVERRGPETACTLAFDENVLDAAGGARVLETFVATAAVLAAEPERSLARWESALPTRRPAGPSGEPADQPGTPAGPIECLSRWAVERPNAAALHEGETTWTYAELARRVAAGAARLQACGVGPGDRVAVVAARSVEQLAACYAAMASGAAFVPIDPSAPEERRRRILEDCTARCVVASPDVAVDPTYTTMSLETLLAPGEETRGLAAARPEAAAYVIYTSGTTGAPKGVAVSHRALGAYLHGVAARLGIESDDVLATLSSVAADLGFTALFGALARGAAVRLLPEALGHDPSALARHLQNRRVDLLKIVPSHLRVLLDELDDDSARQVLPRRCLVLGGERTDRSLLERVAALAPALRVFNHYGPTETTVGVLTAELHAQRPIVVGAPLPGVSTYVLDDTLRPLAPGISGQLYVAGATVARGYLGRAGLTAERFVPDPCGAPGGRMYATGDRVREHPDGRIEFIGRIDDQVKIHGHRIEPAEVEVHLRAIPGVRHAACVVRDEATRPQLVAYVACPASELDVARLRGALARHLPEAMIPAVWVRLESMPLTANGKIDRKRLPPPEAAREAGSHTAPRSAAEQVLAAIWAELLGRDIVGVHDNFFELGGDSIIAIRVAARARRHGLVVSADRVFEKPTIAELAASAGDVSETTAEQGAVVGETPLTPIQARLFENHPQGVAQYNHGRLFIPGVALEVQPLRAALESVLTQHDVLRSRFERRGNACVQVYAPVGSAPLPMEEIPVPAGLDDAARTAWLAERYAAVQASLDPTVGRVMQLVWFPAARPEDSRLLFAVHHLVIDAVSWNVLIEDFLLAYLAHAEGRAPALPEKTSSYREWGTRLQAERHAAALQEEIPYWREVLGTGTMPLPAVSGVGAEANTVGAAARLELEIAPAATAALSMGANASSAMAEALLTALTLALARWTGGSSAVVEMEGHGREALFDGLDLTRTVGWFTARYPFAVTLTADGPAHLALEAVRERLRGVPGRGVGFGRLRYGSGDGAAALGDLPLPGVSFNYLGQMNTARDDRGGLLRPGGDPGPERAAGQWREHLINVNAFVADGRLRIQVTYSTAHFPDEAMRRFVDTFAGVLDDLAQPDRRTARVLRAADAPGAGFTDDIALRDWMRRYLAEGEGEIEALYPLSALQQGMLFHSLLAPRSGAYVLQLVAELEGELDVETFQRAWDWLAARHAVLRTGFAGLDSERPLQFVRGEARVPVDYDDWGGSSVEQQRERLGYLLEADRTRGFAAGEPPMMRVYVRRQSERVHRVVWSRHHAIVDGWSSAILLEELFVAYAALVAGALPELPERPAFSRYIAWLGDHAQLPGAEAFWREYLSGAALPAPRLTSGRSGGDESSFSEDVVAEVDESVAEQLRARAREWRTTPNIVAQSAWAYALARLGRVKEAVFGAVVSGRPEDVAGVEAIVGPFINTVPVRIRPGVGAAGAWLPALHEAQTRRDRFAHTPLAAVHRALALPAHEELFESLLIWESYPVAARVDGAGLPFTVTSARSLDKTNYPVTLYVRPGDGFRLRLSFDAASVERPRAEALLETFRLALRTLVTEGALPDARHALPVDALPPLAAATVGLALAANFNVEPMADALTFWGRKLEHPVRIDLAPYNQAVQALLDDRGVFARDDSAAGWVFVRWQEWLGEGDHGAQARRLDSAVGQLVEALRAAAERRSTPLFVVVCPSRRPEHAALFAEVSARVAALAEAVPHLHVWNAEDAFVRYRVDAPDDANAEAVAHMPYTEEAYVALASEAFRRYIAVARAPYKVLVLDCDDTLWGGICGEVGADGVEIEGQFRRVREIARAARERGLLLCLASRNNEDDVREVFRTRALGLTFEDFAAWRIDWAPKSSNLTALARELNLGLESFIFVDDDPAQCLEVSTHHPEVTVVQMPADDVGTAAVLEHLWALDPGPATAAGADRTHLYTGNREREQVRRAALTLGDFIASLEVQIQAEPLARPHVDRVVELSLRTNQFNARGGRWTAADLARALAAGEIRGRVVHVRDRFGDYGLVGAILIRRDGDTWQVADWWLSCRALGRGVEHAMLRDLAAEAITASVESIVLEAVPGPRNAPALGLLEWLKAWDGARDGGPHAVVLPAARLIALEPGDGVDAPPADTSASVGPRPAVLAPRPVRAYAEIAHMLQDATSVRAAVKAMDGARRSRLPYVAPRAGTEEAVAGVMAELLGLERVGAEDGFFALGGHSILAVRLVGRLHEAFGVQIPLHAVFEAPRVRELALRVDLLRGASAVLEPEDEAAMDVMEI